MNKPLISIITVTFNAEETIGKTLESIKAQTFKDFEHIVIDGASKDKTLQILEQEKGTQTLVFSEPDGGLYDAMNKGIKKAHGEYVIFINSGDSFHNSNTLKEYAEKAREGKDIIYGDTVIVDSSGKMISERHLSVPDSLTKKSFLNGMLICHQAFMVKKNLAPEFDLQYRFSADYDWCVKCIEKSEIDNKSNLRKVTIDYLSEGLTDKNKWKSLGERFQIMTRHYGAFPTILKHISFIFRAIKRGKI